VLDFFEFSESFVAERSDHEYFPSVSDPRLADRAVTAASCALKRDTGGIAAGSDLACCG
jgi:hypothetical protein